MGIRYWRQDYAHRVPRFEVFVYLGLDAATGVHWFRSRKERTLIGRTHYQLNTNGFHPFMLDWKRINTFVETLPNGF
jgi:hypothetical protein